MEENKSKPVFIIGCPRSGTSVISHAIAQHPDFWTSAESDFMLPIVRSNVLADAYKISYDRPDNGWLKVQDVSYKDFLSYMGLGIDKMFLSRSNGKRWVDQTPGYTIIADTLKDMFPDAYFIHILRDGRSVANSMINSDFGKLGFNMKWTKNFKEACRTWSFYAGKGRKFCRENKDRCIEVRHEDLSDNPEETFKKIFKFLNAEYSPKSASLIKTKRLNSSYDEGSRSIVNKKDVSKNNAAKDIWNIWDKRKKKIFIKEAEKTMKELGYIL